jgi:Mg2+-importing ATPase
MAGASLFLPFLPLLPKQILLTNLLTDFPEMTIASDNVDTQMVAQPRRWDIKFIRKFMITFGFVSSLFDFMTFGLLIALDVSAEQFRTAWFLESVVSASLIVFIVRSSSSFFKTRPGDYLIATTLMVVAFTLSLPFTPIAPIVGFVPLPLSLIGLLLMIVMFYLSIAEIAKHIFYRLVKM